MIPPIAAGKAGWGQKDFVVLGFWPGRFEGRFFSFDPTYDRSTISRLKKIIMAAAGSAKRAAPRLPTEIGSRRQCVMVFRGSSEAPAKRNQQRTSGALLMRLEEFLEGPSAALPKIAKAMARGAQRRRPVGARGFFVYRSGNAIRTNTHDRIHPSIIGRYRNSIGSMAAQRGSGTRPRPDRHHRRNAHFKTAAKNKRSLAQILEWFREGGNKPRFPGGGQDSSMAAVKIFQVQMKLGLALYEKPE